MKEGGGNGRKYERVCADAGKEDEVLTFNSATTTTTTEDWALLWSLTRDRLERTHMHTYMLNEAFRERERKKKEVEREGKGME